MSDWQKGFRSFFVAFYLVISYPINVMLISEQSVFYRAPAHKNRKEQVFFSGFCLVASPVTMPIAAVCGIADALVPEEVENE